MNAYLHNKQMYRALICEKVMLGGRQNIVVHISGPSGSGKTTLGNKLKAKFKNKITVKDIDDLRADFVKQYYGGYDVFWSEKKKWNKKEYQKYIDRFVSQNKNKPLIFVGLNNMPWWDKKLYYDMHSTHNFYINISDDIVFRQKCSRFFDDVFVKHKNDVLKDLMGDESKTLKDLRQGFKNECSFKVTKKMNKQWHNDYAEQGYAFLNQEKIFSQVSKLLSK